jgi:predicted acylesterase/phospholipase RssA
MRRHPPRQEYAVVLTDLLRMKPKVFAGPGITWRHLAASCAIPGVLPQRRIHGRWYTDGGLLNPLPVWAAVESGATRIVALHALPEIPGAVLKPFVKTFRAMLGHHPPVPSGVDLTIIETDGPLGSIHDALHWDAENIACWIEKGQNAVRQVSVLP